MQLNVKVAQLLCSRMCHDFVGSTSAINAGLELIHEDPKAPDGPLDLMDKSALQLTRRLAFFRVAFGLAGGAQGAATVNEIRTLASDLFGEGKVSLSWADTEDFGASTALPADVSRVCLNLLLAAGECLPRGGGISVRLLAVSSGVGIAIEAKGVGARISADMANALAPEADIDQVNAYNIHVYYAQSLSCNLGGIIECQGGSESGVIQIAVVFPEA